MNSNLHKPFNMNEQLEKLSLHELFRANNILWIALVMGPIFIAIVLFVMSNSHPEFYSQEAFMKSPFMIIAVAFTAFGVFASGFIYKKKIDEANTLGLSGAKEKMMHYRSALILQCALLEGPTLMCIVFMFIGNNFYFLLLAAILISFQLRTRPSIDKFKNDMQLTSAEKQELSAVGLV